MSSMQEQVKSKHTLLIWIAEYACKHLADDIVKDLVEDITEAQVRTSDLSSLNLKQILILSTIMNDVKEKYAEAINALNSLLDEAIELKALDVYNRLSLGLRIKDIVHSLSLPAVTYREKVHSYLSEEYILPQKLLKHIFSTEEIQGFYKVISDIYHYYMCLRQNYQETERVSDSCQEISTTSLMNLSKIFFKTLQINQPLSTLDKIMEAGYIENHSQNCSEWDELLAIHLSSLNSLDSDSVRRLLLTVKNHNGTSYLTTNSKEAQIWNSSCFLVPSSQFEDEEKCSWKSSTLPDCNIPHIAKFLKKPQQKSCIVLLHRIDSSPTASIKKT